MIYIDVLLLDPQKTYICIIGNISYGDPCHQPGKKGQCH
jgi:hypothetical protein